MTLLIGSVDLVGFAQTPFKPQGQETAGVATVYADGLNAFSFPLANLTQTERTRFAIGNSFFKRNWVQAPASTTARDGLGPHFIARSCGACHAMDGRGQPPAQLNQVNSTQPVDLLIRLSIEPDKPSQNQIQERQKHGVIAHPVYGDQLNNSAIQGVQAEARVTIRTREISGKYPDGQIYTLLQPEYEITQPSYGPIGTETRLSPRIAPQVIGVGLLEAIPQSEILSNQKMQASAGGSVTGRVNHVFDPFLGQNAIGRFGWKANVASLAGQTALAFRGDIGITSTRVPDEACTPFQSDCLKAPSGAEASGVEIEDRLLNEVVFYQATLAPPARRQWDTPVVQRGEKLFHQVQCAACHRPNYTVAEPPLPELSSSHIKGLEIWPYTDLLLHDMGEALADGRSDFEATGREWKTPPLWGIGLIPQVNGHSRLLHDGRARNVEEAILWHGGEADSSKEQFKQLPSADRQALISFVESL